MFVYSRYVLCRVAAARPSHAVCLTRLLCDCLLYDVVYIYLSFFLFSRLFFVCSLLHSRPSVLSLFSVCLRSPKHDWANSLSHKKSVGCMLWLWLWCSFICLAVHWRGRRLLYCLIFIGSRSFWVWSNPSLHILITLHLNLSCVKW